MNEIRLGRTRSCTRVSAVHALSWNGFDMLSYDVVEWGKPLEKTERETPEPRGTEVLLKLKYCGVCHSDVHIRDGYFDLGGGKRLAMSERGINLPATLGHEPYGTVVAGPDLVMLHGEDRRHPDWCGGRPRCREV
jgi:Zn-dependent alcohol dehydrogenase